MSAETKWDRYVKCAIGWESDECCSITTIECGCGYKEKGSYNNPVIDVVSHGSTWKCDKCGHHVQFLWRGMGWIRYRPPDDEHHNIEELLYNK